jgi:hypothetical protein
MHFDWGQFFQAFVVFLGAYFGTKHGNDASK